MKRFALFALALVALAAPSYAHTTEPWKASVRIRIDNDEGGQTVGSGTIVLSQQDRSWVITCAHVFGDWRDPKTFHQRIEVDLFNGQLGGKSGQQMAFVRAVLGKCVDFDHGRDVGLIVFAPGEQLEEARPTEEWPAKGEQLITVGCSNGQDATVWTTEAISGKRGSDGWEGIECQYEPAQGRSGGGLFRLDGHLVGVCDFSVPSTKTGLYASPRSIHALLAKNKMDWIYTTNHHPAAPSPPATPAPPAPTPGPPIAEPAPHAPPRPAIDLSNPVHVAAVLLSLFLILSFGLVTVIVVVVATKVLGARGSAAPAEKPDELRAVILKLRADEEHRQRLAELDELLPKIRTLLFPKLDAAAAAPGAVAGT